MSNEDNGIICFKLGYGIQEYTGLNKKELNKMARKVFVEYLKNKEGMNTN